MNELVELSSANIATYADKLGADYKLLRGNLFRPKLRPAWPPVQKLYMLDESFDKYDMVVMLDPDMFTRKGMNENVFTDLHGVGLFTNVQARLLKHQHRTNPKLAHPDAPWWGGAIYRLDRDLRQKLRAQIREGEISQFCSRRVHGDEGLMHRLAGLAGIKAKGTYFKDNRWCYCSFLPDVHRAALIHIRTKISPTPKSKKRPKIENYRTLVAKGLIEGKTN